MSNAPKPITPLTGGRYEPKSSVFPSADYEKWLKADLWTVKNAILLLINAEYLPHEPGIYDCGEPTKAVDAIIRRKFMDVWDIAEKSLKTGNLKKVGEGKAGLWNEVQPSDFIVWARSKSYPIPDELQIIDSMTQSLTAIQNDVPWTCATPSDDDRDKTLSTLFDLVPVASLEKTFPANGKWKAWAEKAKSNGLIDARLGRAMFNPYIAGKWFVKKGANGWDDARLMRVLANNLPARSRDEKYQLTGELD